MKRKKKKRDRVWERGERDSESEKSEERKNRKRD